MPPPGAISLSIGTNHWHTFNGSDQVIKEAKMELRSLCPSGFHGYFIDKKPIEGTCGWISQRPEFQDWLGEDKDHPMLWIQGPSTCGKGSLARRIITDLIPSVYQEVAHYILSDSLPGRGNLEALLRATLHHALRPEPELIAVFLVPPFLEAVQCPEIRDDEIWTHDRLIGMWPDLMAEVSARRSLTIVADGFDEMERECQQGFLDCLAKFKAKVKLPDDKKGLRVLLLSCENQEADAQLAGHEKFQAYRMKRTFKHLEAAGESWLEVGPQVDQGRELLQDSTTQYAKCWSEVWWLLTWGVAQEYPQDCPVSRVVQAYGPASKLAVAASKEASNTPQPKSESSTARKPHSEPKVALEDKSIKIEQIEAEQDEHEKVELEQAEHERG